MRVLPQRIEKGVYSMDWHTKKVLVTGAGGFIGSHLVESLLDKGCQVRAFVHYNSRNDPGFLKQLPDDALGRVEIIGGDIRDAVAVQQAVQGCEYIFHLGALISIPYSYRHPVEVAETNFLGTLNILNACRQAGVKRLIHTSTSEVYGTALYTPIDEQHPLQGQSPYSASKIAADKMVESYYAAYGLPVVTVRPFNTFGPRQSARAVIPTIITQALARDVIQLGNLDTTRDFTYVTDTVAGFLCAAESPLAEGGTYNLGTGMEMRIGDIAEKIIQFTGRRVEIVVDAQRLRPHRSEVFQLISNNALARQNIDWTPCVGLDEGLQRTIEWTREHLDHFQIGTYQI